MTISQFFGFGQTTGKIRVSRSFINVREVYFRFEKKEIEYAWKYKKIQWKYMSGKLKIISAGKRRIKVPISDCVHAASQILQISLQPHFNIHQKHTNKQTCFSFFLTSCFYLHENIKGGTVILNPSPKIKLFEHSKNRLFSSALSCPTKKISKLGH